jgi:hypothetical protein
MSSIFRAQELSAVFFMLVSLPRLVFSPEDEGFFVLRNVGYLSSDYMALYPRR